MSRLYDTIEWIENFYCGEPTLPDEDEAANTLFIEFISVFEDLVPLAEAGELTPNDLGITMKMEEITCDDEPAFPSYELRCESNISKKLYGYIENINPEALV